MKISKLFHWLYAILMLLPAFAIGVTCAYAIFNKNAYESYNNQNENVYIENNSDFVLNDKYYFSSFNNNGTTTENNIGSYNQRIYIENVELIVNQTSADLSNLASIGFYKGAGSNVISFQFFDNTNTAIGVYTTQNNITFSFNYLSSGINDYFYSLNMFYKTTQTNYLDNVFYYSIDKVQQSPLFNWAYDSFLATPITYITGLFGIAADHISVMLMSYWLAISVIWLVFDMVMYVPLLVHRWIDKGVLE